MDGVIENWNQFFPNYPITTNDIQNPNTIFLIEAYLNFFCEVLGIDSDVILMGIISDEPTAHQDEHIEYYKDLLPVINVAKAIIEIIFNLSSKPLNMQPTKRDITLNCILSPTPQKALTIFTLILNYAQFANQRMKELEPRVSEVFEEVMEMESLMNERDRLLREENERSLEKATRSERMQSYQEEIELHNKQVQECTLVKQEQVQEYETLIRQFKDAKAEGETIKLHEDVNLKDIARLEKEIVIDSKDVLSQHQVAIHTEQTAKEKMKMLKVTSVEKNVALDHFRGLQKKFEAAIILLDDGILLAKRLKEMRCAAVPDGGNKVKLQRMQKELASEKAALDKLQVDAQEEKETYLMRLKTLNALSLESQGLKKDAEDYEAAIDSKMKSIKLENLKAASHGYNAERINIVERLKTEDDKFIQKIRDYELYLDAILEKAQSKIMTQ